MAKKAAVSGIAVIIVSHDSPEPNLGLQQGEEP